MHAYVLHVTPIPRNAANMPSTKTVALNLRIAPDKKAALAGLANQKGTDITKLVMPLIDRMLRDWPTVPVEKSEAEGTQNIAASVAPQNTNPSEVHARENKYDESLDEEENRINFRALPGDAKMMKATAARRGMKPSEFMKLLLRSWVSGGAILPEKELNALSNTLNELGAVGRNLNQITRRIHSGGYPVDESLATTLSGTHELVLQLKEDIRAVIKANIDSWERSYAE